VAQDNLIDIQDFAVLAIEWNQSVDPNFGMLADSTGDGVQSTPDFNVVSQNFAVVGHAADGCGPKRIGASNVLVKMRGRVAVDQLLTPRAADADLNADGIVNVVDVRLFAVRHGIEVTPRLEASLSRLVQIDDGRVDGKRNRDNR
jgi:hypothetical protein